MAVDFIQSQSQAFLYTGSAIVDAVPLSMFCWFNPGAIVASRSTLITIVNRPPGFGGSQAFRLGLSGDEFGPQTIEAEASPSAFLSSVATSSASYAASSWQNAGAVFATDADRTAYLNGVAGTPDTSSFGTPAGMNDTLIGSNVTNNASQFFGGFGGCMALATIWNVALNDSQMTALNGGADPMTIMNANIVLHVPMLNNATKTANAVGASLTANSGLGSYATCDSAPSFLSPAGTGRRFLAMPGPVRRSA